MYSIIKIFKTHRLNSIYEIQLNLQHKEQRYKHSFLYTWLLKKVIRWHIRHSTNNLLTYYFKVHILVLTIVETAEAEVTAA